jgi:hypothetical protein
MRVGPPIVLDVEDLIVCMAKNIRSSPDCWSYGQPGLHAAGAAAQATTTWAEFTRAPSHNRRVQSASSHRPTNSDRRRNRFGAVQTKRIRCPERRRMGTPDLRSWDERGGGGWDERGGDCSW